MILKSTDLLIDLFRKLVHLIKNVYFPFPKLETDAECLKSLEFVMFCNEVPPQPPPPLSPLLLFLQLLPGMLHLIVIKSILIGEKLSAPLMGHFTPSFKVVLNWLVVNKVEIIM